MVEVTKQGGKERLLVSFELGLEKWKLAFAEDLSNPKRVQEIAARELGAGTREMAKARRLAPISSSLRSSTYSSSGANRRFDPR